MQRVKTNNKKEKKEKRKKRERKREERFLSHKQMGYVKELSNSFFFEIPESEVKGKEEKGTRDEAMKGS